MRDRLKRAVNEAAKSEETKRVAALDFARKEEILKFAVAVSRLKQTLDAHNMYDVDAVLYQKFQRLIAQSEYVSDQLTWDTEASFTASAARVNALKSIIEWADKSLDNQFDAETDTATSKILLAELNSQEWTDNKILSIAAGVTLVLLGLALAASYACLGVLAFASVATALNGFSAIVEGIVCASVVPFSLVAFGGCGYTLFTAKRLNAAREVEELDNYFKSPNRATPAC